MPSNKLGRLSQVSLAGKLSKVGKLKYTPAGLPILEAAIAVPQSYLEKKSTGYFSLLLDGEVAERASDKLRIGKSVLVRGSLWTRTFKNRLGNQVTEFHIIVEEIKLDQIGDKNEKV